MKERNFDRTHQSTVTEIFQRGVSRPVAESTRQPAPCIRITPVPESAAMRGLTLTSTISGRIPIEHALDNRLIRRVPGQPFADYPLSGVLHE